MKAKHIVNLILDVHTREDIELANAVRDKYIKENPEDELGIWQIYECGEILYKVGLCLDEIEVKGESAERKKVDGGADLQSMRECCTTPEEHAEQDRWERWFRHWVNRRAMYHSFLRERAKAYVKWD